MTSICIYLLLFCTLNLQCTCTLNAWEILIIIGLQYELLNVEQVNGVDTRRG